jgi:nuclear pore complex protein Nup98-Nup96
MIHTLGNNKPSIFGQPAQATTQPTTGFGVFGGQQQQNQQGQPNQQPTGGLFGGGSGGLFGQTNNQQQQGQQPNQGGGCMCPISYISYSCSLKCDL